MDVSRLCEGRVGTGRASSLCRCHPRARRPRRPLMNLCSPLIPKPRVSSGGVTSQIWLGSQPDSRVASHSRPHNPLFLLSSAAGGLPMLGTEAIAPAPGAAGLCAWRELPSQVDALRGFGACSGTAEFLVPAVVTPNSHPAKPAVGSAPSRGFQNIHGSVPPPPPRHSRTFLSS